MPRPKRCRRVRINPKAYYFKPQGIPLRVLEDVSLSIEELEALKLKNIEKLSQEECAEKMNTSQSTFQRIISSAHRKVSEALIKGKAVKIMRKDF